MDTAREPNWFAIHAKARRESFAAQNVRALGIEVFLPQVRDECLIHRCWRMVTKPLFAGYLFAHFCPVEFLESVRHAHGVLTVLSTGRLPIPIDDRIIANLRSRAEGDGYVRLKKRPLRSGDRVQIEEGSFAGWVGQVEREYDDCKRVAILLEAVDFCRIVVEKRSLTVLSKALVG
jgi:transcription antitermination factor NusG